jgi:hypothetical protein
MSWEGRARKLEAKRQYMRKHGYSVFVMEAAERKRIAEGKAPAPSRSGKVSRRTGRRHRPAR